MTTDELNETFLLTDPQRRWDFEEALHDWTYPLDEIRFDEQRQLVIVVFKPDDPETEYTHEVEAIFPGVESLCLTDERGWGTGMLLSITVEDKMITISGGYPATVTMIVSGEKIVHLTGLKECRPQTDEIAPTSDTP